MEGPLALEQAGAYMTNGVQMSFEDYVTSFRNQKTRAEQMSYPPEYRFYEFTVRTTWFMSLVKLQAAAHPMAVDLLQFCSFLHPDRIPKELVVALLPAYFAPAGRTFREQNTLYNRLLTVLTGYSLIQRDLEKGTHSVHVMVQTVLRDTLLPEVKQRACEHILAAIARSFPSDDAVLDGKGALYYPHAERLRHYVDLSGMELRTVARLRHHMGVFLYHQGRFAEAEPHLQQALQTRQKELVADDPDVATSINNLAALYGDQGRFVEAEPLLREALTMRERVLPERYRTTAGTPDHSEIPDEDKHKVKAYVESLNNLATLYQSQRRYDEAEPHYQKALEMKLKWLSERHRCIIVGYNNLASVYQNQKRYNEAEYHYREALTMVQAKLPDGYPYVAVSLNNLAVLY